MSTDSSLDEILEIIQASNPYSDEESIKKAIIEYISNNLEEFLLKIDLPRRDQIAQYSRKEQYKIARSRIRSSRENEAKTTLEIVSLLAKFQQEFSDEGNTPDADKITKYIKSIEVASSEKKSVLNFADSTLGEKLRIEESSDDSINILQDLKNN